MRTLLLVLLSALAATAQTPPIEPGVSHELAKWRAARYSDIRYKLNLTIEKMSPVLKGTMEIRVKVANSTDPAINAPFITPIMLDWRKIRGSESLSTVSNITLNNVPVGPHRDGLRPLSEPLFREIYDHLEITGGVVPGENVIKLDFTSPILTSGSAITRYVDKEDGAEYIYSLFVPSDASTAFPVFDQPDLKARFELAVSTPWEWRVVSNSVQEAHEGFTFKDRNMLPRRPDTTNRGLFSDFPETNPISTYVFAFAAGPFERMVEPDGKSRNVKLELKEVYKNSLGNDVSYRVTPEELKKFKQVDPDDPPSANIYVRKSQAAKFKPHAAEVFRLNREGIRYLEQYFDYKFPFPKYDLVLIPEFPFGGMEHAGATFLRESSIIFPTEPTKSDYISRANLIFHEAAHQWFGDMVTMKWFDDLWLKEGFAEFMAYKTLERVMPDANAWKVFYERNKQAAYLTDSTRGTTPIYQKIDNLSSAKSAYGNIVYRKAPSFLKQAEFYLGADKFQTAVRAFLKKHEYANAGWEDLVKGFQNVAIDKLKQNKNYPEDKKQAEEQRLREDIKNWAIIWVNQRGVPIVKSAETDVYVDVITGESYKYRTCCMFTQILDGKKAWPMRLQTLIRRTDEKDRVLDESFNTDENSGAFFSDALSGTLSPERAKTAPLPLFVFPNYQDHGYGIFLLDDKSREYVLKNIQNEKDAFLRSMMWGALWDSVRESELDPAVYVELAIKQLGGQDAKARASARAKSDRDLLETDETIVASLLGRVSTALNYYIPAPDIALANARASATSDQRSRFEAVLLDRLQNAPTPGQRITFYRSFVANASTAKGREVLKEMLRQSVPGTVVTGARTPSQKAPVATAPGTDKPAAVPLRTKDRFDIVQRLIILGDPDALKLLADLEKTETTDDAKRYAYAARAGIATAENKAKYWNDFTSNKDISESWIEAAFGPWNSIRHSLLTLPYLQKALQELPNHKRNRKIFFVNGWLGAFISGQRSEEALNIVNKFLADNPTLDNDLRLKILENVDMIERAVRIRKKFGHE